MLVITLRERRNSYDNKRNQIKSIEITLGEGYIFKIDFNGYKEKEGYDLMLSNDNALRVARTLTRLANVFWEHYDKIANERKEE